MAIELKKILYVDDDPDILQLVKLSFELEGGYEVSLFKNGHDVLKKVEALDPQLILLDVMMPEMDGITLCHHLRSISGFEIRPIVFVTAKIQISGSDCYQQSGANDVIGKPFSPTGLPSRVSKVWQTYLTGQGV